MQPTVYNITYYRGDDFTLYIFPKDSTGVAIPLDTAQPYFRVASGRGDTPTWSANAAASIQRLVTNGPQAIFCQMSGTVGSNIRNGYVYDIGYVLNNKRTTVITGNFQVMDKVSVDGNSA
jgi:hypothetical protein